jgi:hypothetical protein
VIKHDLLKRMLERENQIRLSEDQQFLYSQVEDIHKGRDWMDLTEDLQLGVVREFGFVGHEQEQWALGILRTATQIYPDLKDIPLYVKYNRARRGRLQEGMEMPNVKLIEVESGNLVLLGDLCHKMMPTVLVAGSYT